jgi:UrcA family protein
MKTLKALIPATALAALYSCAPVWAATSETRSVTVHFEDLNINNALGAARLYQRIEYAAKDVCGGNLAPQRVLVLSSLYATCVRGAIAGAVAHVNHPAVTEYAAARGIVPARPARQVKFASKE